MKVSEFKELPQVKSGKKRIGQKTDWSILREFLQKNKDKAYSVKECHDFVNANAMLKDGTSISRVRVYKELEKYVKKGKVVKRVDEDNNDAGYYNWAHIEKE